MKKYYIPTDENNRAQVLDALKAAGFKATEYLKSLDGDLLVTCEPGYISYTYNFDWVICNNHHLLEASYVIKHAAKLDGARKPWEIPPKGYRLVTDEERVENDYPEGVELKWRRHAEVSWFESFTEKCWKSNLTTSENPVYWAIPEDYKFTDKVKVCIDGKEGYISKESAEELGKLLKQGEIR